MQELLDKKRRRVRLSHQFSFTTTDTTLSQVLDLCVGFGVYEYLSAAALCEALAIAYAPQFPSNTW